MHLVGDTPLLKPNKICLQQVNVKSPTNSSKNFQIVSVHKELTMQEDSVEVIDKKKEQRGPRCEP